VVQCEQICLGRRPEGFVGDAPGCRTALGAYFEQSAQLEAASVPAFRRMARELARFGAPRRLVRAAERAAREEERHARGAAALARRFGGKRGAFEAQARGARSLEEFTLENAVEGCVRETYGALVATWQASAAIDPNVRAHMKRIAKEETSHAALAWRTDAWARTKLTAAARARIDAARARASQDLVEQSGTPIPAALANVAGVPDAALAKRFATELATRLA
jgi:hypothetical protein